MKATPMGPVPYRDRCARCSRFGRRYWVDFYRGHYFFACPRHEAAVREEVT